MYINLQGHEVILMGCYVHVFEVPWRSKTRRYHCSYYARDRWDFVSIALAYGFTGSDLKNPSVIMDTAARTLLERHAQNFDNGLRQAAALAEKLNPIG